MLWKNSYFVTRKCLRGTGFSINLQMLELNMKEQSLVAQRIGYEGVSKEVAILKLNIRRKCSLIWNNSEGLLEQLKQKTKSIKLLEKVERQAVKKKGCSSWKEGCIGLYIKGSLCLWCHMIYIERETSKFTVVEVYCWCCIFPYLLLFSL